VPDDDPFEPIEGCSLVRYAAISRELVRGHRGALTTADGILEVHRLTADSWSRIQQGWAARIRASDAVRAAFRELYARDQAVDGSWRSPSRS
jgi:hypothetical protein